MSLPVSPVKKRRVSAVWKEEAAEVVKKRRFSIPTPVLKPTPVHVVAEEVEEVLEQPQIIPDADSDWKRKVAALLLQDNVTFESIQQMFNIK
jgi:hypothetical protein